MVNWEPIDTAPKDGSKVDLWINGEREADCRWMKPTEGGSVQWCFFHANLGYWVAVRHNPTHWMRVFGP